LYDTARSESMTSTKTTIAGVALSLLLSLSAYAGEHRLVKGSSKVQFELEGQTLQADGAFDSYSGALLIDQKSRILKQVTFLIDVTKVTIDADDPRARLLIQQLIASLPTARVSFKSTEVRKQGDGSYLVIGEASSQAGKETVSVPVEVTSEDNVTWRVRGSLRGENVFSGPEALLLGKNSGRVRFDLRFS